ncbi:DUF4169 family protein [Alkalicaulis satelles]|uniref:DUF4169 family protein n=1 Tax=Alkalicaulis satelles TaxID=2609175 RepID=A0A5M6ZEN7_9PROT|nr:DUF4169 family protein [Alkalicaulis satelles]KAA5801558.1 DUF4169 family protein [Alkalicaulis satelles]
MTKPVNLNRYRKARARADKARQADINRVTFGSPKALREAQKAREEQAARALEGHRREGGDGEGDN